MKVGDRIRIRQESRSLYRGRDGTVTEVCNADLCKVRVDEPTPGCFRGHEEPCWDFDIEPIAA